MTTPSNAATQPDNNRRRWFAALAALGGVGLLPASAQARGWRERPDPEERARRLEWRIGRLVQDAGGTPQQKDRLVAIATAALADLRPLREQLRQSRRRGLELLATPVIDRVALERLRVEQQQLADSRSRRVLQAVTEAADVLTPEQRVKVAERLKRRIGRRRQV